MEKKLQNWLISNKIKIKWGGVILFIFSHQARAIMCVYILSHNKCRPLKILIRKFLRAHYHIECSCSNIGDGLRLPHPRNIIIGAEKIGNNVQINQNVTIGGNMKKTCIRPWGEQKRPIIGNSVVIYTNAVVGGPVVIEDHVIVGANCVCTHDIPSNTLIYNTSQLSSRKILVTDGSFQYI